jgi:hypothetical protein
MMAVGVFLAMATIWLAGAGCVLALWRGSQAILGAELFGLGWLLGAGLISVALTLAGTVFSGAALIGAVASIAIIFAALGVKRLRDGVRVSTGFHGAAPWEKWLSLIALLPILYMAAVTFRDAINWDGLFNWESKARHAFLSGGVLPASYFSDESRLRNHLSYPLYLPFTELWIYLCIGDCHQTAVKLLFPTFFAAAIALLWSAARRLTDCLWIAAATALIPLFIPWMTDHGLGLLQGYPDFILAAVYLASVAALLVWQVKGVEGAWPVAAAGAALLPWVKQEGVLLLVSVLAQAALARGWRGWRSTLLFSAPALAGLIAWRLGLSALQTVEESVFHPVTLASLQANLPRLNTIFHLMAGQLSLRENWSLLWWGVPLALACLAWQRRRETLGLTVAIGLPLLLDVVPYLFTRLDLFFHIQSSLDRLVLQISLVAVLTLGLALEGKRPSNADGC